MNNILEKIITINKVEKGLTSTGKQLIKIKDNQNLSHQLWPIKQDGTESKAYQFFKTLPMDGIGMTVRVSYKEEQGDYNGKAVVYRTIIGMDNGNVSNSLNQVKTPSTGFVGAKTGYVAGRPDQSDEIRANVALKMVSEILAAGVVPITEWKLWADNFYNYKPNDTKDEPLSEEELNSISINDL